MISSIMHTFGFKSANDTYGGHRLQRALAFGRAADTRFATAARNNTPPAADWPKDADVERQKQAKKDDTPHYPKDNVIEFLSCVAAR